MKRNQMTNPAAAAAPTPFTRKKLAAALLLTMQPMIAMLSAQSAHAQLTPDAGATQQASIHAAANGVPIVNITGPNAAGVSHNLFTDYNVGKPGLILNNSNIAVNTQLGGRIDGNSGLGSAPAQVILNEVTGSSPSLLNGSTEIAGKAAHLIVANPNGIAANGAAFINATRITLTTGKPLFDSAGNVAAFDLAQGRIAVAGDGLDAKNGDRLDLITRSLELNATLRAKQLNVVTGAGRYEVAQNAMSRPQGFAAQGDAPTVAIDVAKLGGMYADAISLVGTEAGVGFNVAGKLQSLTGDIAISADGAVVLAADSSLSSAAAITARTSSLTNAGRVESTGDFRFDGRQMNNSGALVSDSDVLISGDLKNTNGDVFAENLRTGGNLDNRMGFVDLNGSLHVGRNLDNAGGTIGAAGVLSVANKFDNTNGTLAADSDVYAGDIVNRQGRMEVNRKIVAGGALDNQGGTVEAGEISVIGRLDNAKGMLTSRRGINAGDVVNRDGKLNAKGAIIVDNGLDNRRGLIKTGGEMRIHGNFDNSETKGKKQGLVAGKLFVDGTTNNTIGVITAKYGFVRQFGSVWGNGGKIVNQSNPGDPNGYPIGYDYGVSKL